MDNKKYREEYKKAVKNNINALLKEIDGQDMIDKISNWANKFEYTFDEVRGKILEDEMFQCVFIKEPSRQNLYEKLAGKYIESLEIVENFKFLSSGGKDAKYMINGKMFKGCDLEGQAKDTKSIDFQWTVGNWEFYATHKYTKDGGGAQDNQYEDVQKFLHNTRDCNIKNTIFLAICDGEYYLAKDSKTGDETKIQRLQRLTDNKTSFVMQINELKDFLQKYL